MTGADNTSGNRLCLCTHPEQHHAVAAGGDGKRVCLHHDRNETGTTRIKRCECTDFRSVDEASESELAPAPTTPEEQAREDAFVQRMTHELGLDKEETT